MRQSFRAPFEMKSLSEQDGALSFEGYGSVFGNIDSYGDTIAKGAFAASLADWQTRGKLPKMLLQHGGAFGMNADDLIPVGKWTEMYEDDHGLYLKGRLFDVDTDRARATYAAAKEGELDGLSIGFQTIKSNRDEQSGIRTLSEVRLWEVSLVTFPANDAARVLDVRSQMPTEREFERFLRDAGFSRTQAKAITSCGYAAAQRDAAPDVSKLLAAMNQRTAILTAGADQ